MSEPSRRPAAFRLIASAIFLVLVVGGLWLQSRPASPPPEAPPPASAPRPVIPLPPPPLGREALLDAAADAADAFASGRPGAADLVGRSFELRFVFGCNGAALEGSSAPQRWEYDPEAQALRVRVSPVDFTAAPWVAGIAADGYEAAEGFWIDRPWQRTSACPRTPPAGSGASLTLPRDTLAIVELFAAGAPRSRQREERAYEIVRKATPEQVAQIRGFALVLEGRLTALPSGQPIGCWAPNADLRPTCLISARFERVRLEELGSAEPLAEWQL